MAIPKPSINAAHPAVWTLVRPALCALALAAGLSASGGATAAQYRAKDVGNWTVAASKDGKGCFLTRQYDRNGGTTLLFGLDADGTNHLSVLNENWSIKPKDQLKLDFRLSSGSYPKHFAIGMASEGKQGFVTSFEPKFPTYLAASRSLDIARGKVPVERLNLDGSGAAIAELRNCVGVQRANPAPAIAEEDHPGRIPKDPFAPTQRQKRKK